MPFPETQHMPETLDEAVNMLIDALDPEERQIMLDYPAEAFHRSLGMTIRNEWGLNGGRNPKLLESCQLNDLEQLYAADEASGKIIEAVQAKLREIMKPA